MLPASGVPNLATFSLFNAISSFPPMLMFCANALPFRVAKSPVRVKSRVVQHLEFPAGDQADRYTMIIRKVVAIHIRDDLMADGRVDLHRLKPFTRFSSLDYAVGSQRDV